MNMALSKAEQLLAKFGNHARESLGGTRPATSLAIAGIVGPTISIGSREGVKTHRAAAILELVRIIPDPEQPRKEFDQAGIDHLAASIKARGILQPLRVRWEASLEKWVLICGERRYRAAQSAGLETVPVILVDGPVSPGDLLEDQLVENLLRDDLKPMETAQAYRKLMDLRKCTGKELAAILKVDPATVSRSLALLKLPDEIQEQVDAGRIAPKTAVELARLPEQDAKAMVEMVLKNKLNAQEAAQEARKRTQNSKPTRKTIETIRTANGARITVSFRGKVDQAAIEAALVDALEQVRIRTR